MKWSALFRAPKLQLLSQEKSLLGTISRRTIVIPYCSSKRKNSTEENAPHVVLFLHGRRKKQKFDWIKFIIKEICSETNTHTALGWQVTFWLWQPGEMDRRKREEKGATKYWDFHNSANLQSGHQLLTDSADWDKIGKMSPGTCWASGVCVFVCASVLTSSKIDMSGCLRTSLWFDLLATGDSSVQQESKKKENSVCSRLLGSIRCYLFVLLGIFRERVGLIEFCISMQGFVCVSLSWRFEF